MRGSPTGHKVSHASMFVARIVVHMTGEDHDTITSLRLALLQESGQCLLRGARRVATTYMRVRRTGVGRMMEQQHHKIHFRRDVIQFSGQPLALSPANFVKGAVERKNQHISRTYRVVPAVT